jgi:hypothetical protein
MALLAFSEWCGINLSGPAWKGPEINKKEEKDRGAHHRKSRKIPNNTMRPTMTFDLKNTKACSRSTPFLIL